MKKEYFSQEPLIDILELDVTDPEGLLRQLRKYNTSLPSLEGRSPIEAFKTIADYVNNDREKSRKALQRQNFFRKLLAFIISRTEKASHLLGLSTELLTPLDRGYALEWLQEHMHHVAIRHSDNRAEFHWTLVRNLPGSTSSIRDQGFSEEELKKAIKEFTTPQGQLSVKSIRDSLDMSQSEFSTEFRIPLNTLKAWEQNINLPTGATELALLAIALRPDFMRQCASLLREAEKIVAIRP